MIVAIDTQDIKDKLNDLVSIMKAKPKSKYGKGKRKQKVAVRTPSGKVVMATRTVGEGENKKPKPLSPKQHQMIKDTFKDEPVHKDGKKHFQQHVLLSLVDKLDHIHPNHGMTDDDIKHHVKNHPDFHAFHGRDSLFINMNVDKKGEKKVKEKPKKISTVHPDNYPDPASVSGTLYPDNTTDDSDFITFIENHPDNKDDNVDFHPGLKDPKWARKAEFAAILQSYIYPKSGFGYGKDWEKEKKKPDISNLTMEQVESALRQANNSSPSMTYNRTAYNHFGGVANGKKISKERELAPITLKDVESIYKPCLNFDYEKSLKLWNELDKGGGKNVEMDYEFREIKEVKTTPRQQKIDSAINKLIGSNVRNFAEKITNGEVPIDTMIKMQEALEMTHPSLKVKVSDIKKHIKRNAQSYINQAEYENKYVENLIHTAFTNTRERGKLMVYHLLDHDTLPDKMLKKLESVLAKTHPEISISLGDIKAHLAKYDKTYRERLAETGYKDNRGKSNKQKEEKPPKQRERAYGRARGSRNINEAIKKNMAHLSPRHNDPEGFGANNGWVPHSDENGNGLADNLQLQHLSEEQMSAKILNLGGVVKKVNGKNHYKMLGDINSPAKGKKKSSSSKPAPATGDVEGFKKALFSFEKNKQPIPRNQFHAMRNKFGVKDHKQHAQNWVFDKASDSYVHDNSWKDRRIGEVGTPGIPGIQEYLRRGNRSARAKDKTPPKPIDPLQQAMDRSMMDKHFGRKKKSKK